jgi:hypothetical protein
MAASPSLTGTWATMTFFVLVLWNRTFVRLLVTSTSPSSMANGPTADEQFPQLPL